MKEGVSCPECEMVLSGAGSLKLYKRDVHQGEVKVLFMGDTQERVLTRDENGYFNCPLDACPLRTKKPNSMQVHCRAKSYCIARDISKGRCIVYVYTYLINLWLLICF